MYLMLIITMIMIVNARDYASRHRQIHASSTLRRMEQTPPEKLTVQMQS